ncbi:MAG: hypothetical protein ACLFP1_09585, partial [Candidatus Goldiibacteriota bacterium]
MKRVALLTLFIAVFMCGTLSAEVLSKKSRNAEKKTDLKADANVIGVAGGAREYTYIDMGAAQGIKKGDSFFINGRQGKVKVKVVKVFQRMSAVQIDNSYLLEQGQGGEIIPSERYAKSEIKSYKLKPYTVKTPGRKKPVKKSVKPKPTPKPTKTPETQVRRTEEPAAPDMDDMDLSGMPGDEDAFGLPGDEDDMGMDFPGMDMPADDDMEDMPPMDDMGMDMP